ncbi:MAG TPA: LysR substrate-binding domain-containing protein [Xanthobacteraceae bacterium]|jgi:DNA-binding transcriptional LysR family regulator|nr:LysR substrate-binding domain-containing protein [Xanthobacteraceae bacterium]
MDLRQLRYFVGIVQAGSLSRAASHLRVAQSAISQHLAHLETELKQKLLIRGLKGVDLTDAGAVLYRHAEAILRHMDVAKQQAMTAVSEPSGRVAVGLPSALSNVVGYEFLKQMLQDYPRIVLHLTDGNSSLLRERLDNGRLDIALLFLSRSERELLVKPFGMEELFYVSAKPGVAPVTLREIAERPLLLPGPGSGIEKAVREAFKGHEIGPTIIGEIDTMTTLRRAVAAGVADTILPWAALTEESGKRGLHGRRFTDVKLIRPVALCFSEVSDRGPAIDAAAATLKKVIETLIKKRKWQGVNPS